MLALCSGQPWTILFLLDLIKSVFFLLACFVSYFGTEIGTENRGFSLVSVPKYWNFGTVTTLQPAPTHTYMEVSSNLEDLN